MKIVHLTSCCALLFSTVLHAQTDQTLVYGTYYGTDLSQPTDMEVVTTVGAYSDGGYIIAGNSPSTQGLATNNGYQMFGQGASTGFVARFDANHNRLWGTYYGGPLLDDIIDHAVFSDGRIVFGGQTHSQTGIALPGAYQEIANQNTTNAFLTCFNGDGLPIWSTYFNGEENTSSFITGITALEDDVVVVGFTDALDFPVTEGAYQPMNAGGLDGFVARFNANGELLWCTYIGGSSSDLLEAIVSDSQNNLLVLGRSLSNDFPVSPDAHKTEIEGFQDMVLLKFSEDGDLIWGTYFGGEGDSDFPGFDPIDVDSEGNVYISGRTDSYTGIATPGAFQESLTNDFPWSQNGFVACFEPDGTLNWSSYIGINEAQANGIRYLNGRVVITGTTGAPVEGSEIIVGSPWQPDFSDGSTTGFMSAFTDDGQYIWGTYLGGTGGTSPFALGRYSANQILIGGSTNSGDGISTEDAFMPIHPGGTNGFLALFELDFSVSVPEKEHLSLNAYPNPTTQHLWLDLPPSFAFHAEVSVYNSVGQLVQRHTQFSSHESLSLQHPPGLYIVEARKGDNAVRAKVVVR